MIQTFFKRFHRFSIGKDIFSYLFYVLTSKKIESQTESDCFVNLFHYKVLRIGEMLVLILNNRKKD